MKFYTIMKYTQSGELVQVTKKNYAGYANAQHAAGYEARRKEEVYIVLSVEKDSNEFPVVTHEVTVTWEGIYYDRRHGDPPPSYATLNPKGKK